MIYDEAISKLEKIVENWYDRDKLIKYIEHPNDGLCDNIKTGSAWLVRESIQSWAYFDGDWLYPVDGFDEYCKGVEIPYALFDNPKRLHLAVHMLQWFREHNIKEI